MWKDPIVEEIREESTRYAEQFDFDLDAIFADLKRREQTGVHRLVSLSPKRIMQCEEVVQ